MRKKLNKYLTSGNLYIILLALLIPAFFIRYFFANAQIITNDGVLYIKIAKGISSGNLQGVTDYGFFNLYSFLIALFQTVLRDWEFSGKMVSVVFGTLTIIPLFFLTRELFNQNIAIVSVLFYAIHPRFVEYSSDVLRDPVFWFFSIASLWLACEGISRKKYFVFVFASLSTGLAMFTRSEGILSFIVVILWIVWASIKESKQRKRAFAYMAIYVFSLPLLMAPFLFVLKENTNKWELGHPIEKIVQYIRSNDNKEIQPIESDKSSEGKKGIVELSRIHWFGASFLDVLYKFFKSFNVALFFLFLCGVYSRRSIPYSQSDAMLLIWISVVLLGLFCYLTKVDYLGTRHGLLMVFPALAWAGVGLFEIRERIRKWFGNVKLFQRYAHFDTLFLIILILIILVPQTVFSYRYDKVELKKAGIVLKNMGFSNTTFIVEPTLSRVAFYADADAVQLPNEADAGKLVVFLEKHKDKLLVVNDRTIYNYAPSIKKIIIDNKFERLTIPEMDQYKKYSFSIYRIN